MASRTLDRVNDWLGIPKPRHPSSGVVIGGGIAAWIAYTVVFVIIAPCSLLPLIEKFLAKQRRPATRGAISITRLAT